MDVLQPLYSEFSKTLHILSVKEIPTASCWLLFSGGDTSEVIIEPLVAKK